MPTKCAVKEFTNGTNITQRTRAPNHSESLCTPLATSLQGDVARLTLYTQFHPWCTPTASQRSRWHVGHNTGVQRALNPTAARHNKPPLSPCLRQRESSAAIKQEQDGGCERATRAARVSPRRLAVCCVMCAIHTCTLEA